MRRSEINRAYLDALACFRRNGWALPPEPRWDITDFGLGDFPHCGLTLVNLATEPEYCEKLMYARQNQLTPCHAHALKKEDIICRCGALSVWLWSSRPGTTSEGPGDDITVNVNGSPRTFASGELLVLPAGQRVTLAPGVWHAFAPASEECIMGEVSTANDDEHDNLFADAAIGRFPGVEEDEAALVRLVSEAA